MHTPWTSRTPSPLQPCARVCQPVRVRLLARTCTYTHMRAREYAQVRVHTSLTPRVLDPHTTRAQVSELELEQIARMSTEQLLDDGVMEGAGGDATRQLLGQYGPTPLRAASTAATPARTAPHGDRIQQEAQNLARLTVRVPARPAVRNCMRRDMKARACVRVKWPEASCKRGRAHPHARTPAHSLCVLDVWVVMGQPRGAATRGCWGGSHVPADTHMMPCQE